VPAGPIGLRERELPWRRRARRGSRNGEQLQQLFALTVMVPVTTCKGGPDTHGYYPNSGYYGLAADIYCPPTSGQTWSGNVWDDDDMAIDCP
jgi:hypothetical protein